MSTDLLERPEVTERYTTDPEMVAHIVYPAHKVTEAHVMGTPVEALCGHVWVPSRLPDDASVCEGCQEVYEKLRGKRWG